jgi:hypothetical protein
MKNLNEYYKQTKIENSPNENDFAVLLNKVNTRTEVRENFYRNNNTTQKVKSPFFAWSFGFTGFAMAALMFFINTNTQSVQPENLALVDSVVMKSTNITIDKEARKAKVGEAIDLIDSMNSFNMVTN